MNAKKRLQKLKVSLLKTKQLTLDLLPSESRSFSRYCTKSILKRSNAGLNSEFSKAKEPTSGDDKNRRIHAFPMCENIIVHDMNSGRWFHSLQR